MHAHAGAVVVALLIVAPFALSLARRASRARVSLGRSQAGGSSRGGWLSHRRALRLERTRHENAKVRDEAKHKHRLAEQEAARQAKAADGGPRGGTVRGKVMRLGDEPPPADGKPKPAAKPGDDPRAGAPAEAGPVPPQPSGSPASPAQPADADAKPEYGTRLQFRPAYPPKPSAAGPSPSAAPPQEPPARNGAAPAASITEPGQPQSPTIEGVVMTVMPDSPGTLSVPGVEMIIEGAMALRRHMMSGTARAKRAGVLGTVLAADALAGMVLAVSREMAEPGQHYGPEVTDPLAMAAVHFSGASLGLSEVDGRLQAIIKAAEELAARGVQAPHHDQMAVS